MKKNNWIVYGLCFVASIALLFVWYALGLNRIDEPRDLIITIIWWAFIVVAIIVVIAVENKRKARIRTMYVGPNFIYNSEKGEKDFPEWPQLMNVMDKTLADLNYDFGKNELSEKRQPEVQHVVYTEEYGPAVWKGNVFSYKTNEETHFDDKAQLSTILNRLNAAK